MACFTRLLNPRVTRKEALASLLAGMGLGLFYAG